MHTLWTHRPPEECTYVRDRRAALPVGGPHPVTDPSCRVFIREKEVNREITETGCTRDLAEAKFPPLPAAVPPPYVAPTPEPIPTLVTTNGSYADIASTISATHNDQPCLTPQPLPAIDALAANLCALTAILNQLLEQNKTIISQNAEVIRLLSAPKLKQSTLAFTPVNPRGPATPRASQSTPRPVLAVAQVGKTPKRLRISDDQQAADRVAIEQAVILQPVNDPVEVENRPD